MSAVLKEQIKAKPSAARRAAPDPLTWQPSVSSARRHFHLKVGNVVAQRCFTETFVYAQISMNMLTSYLPFVVTSEEFSAVHDVIKQDFSKIDSEISDEMIRLDSLYKSVCAEEWPAKDYTRPLDLKVPYYTREAGHVLALIEKFDDLLWRLDILRFNELINTEQRTATVNRYKKLLMGLPRRMTELWTRTRKSIDRARAAERSKKGPSHAETLGQTAPADLDERLNAVDAELSQNASDADHAIDKTDDAPFASLDAEA